MSKIMIPIILIALVATGIFAYFQFSGSENNATNDSTEETLIDDTISIQGFTVEKLPAFAITDCQNKGGYVKEVIAKGEAIEKCIVPEQ